MRGLIAWTVVAITVLSLWWTTRKARALLRQALGRELRDGEEMSLTSWMQASDASLENASRELDRDPFERCLRFFASLGLWSPFRPQDDTTVLKRDASAHDV
jgi:hypothetical protein